MKVLWGLGRGANISGDSTKTSYFRQQQHSKLKAWSYLDVCPQASRKTAQDKRLRLGKNISVEKKVNGLIWFEWSIESRENINKKNFTGDNSFHSLCDIIHYFPFLFLFRILFPMIQWADSNLLSVHVPSSFSKLTTAVRNCLFFFLIPFTISLWRTTFSPI